MSLKTFKFPDSVPIERAAMAWGLEAEPLHKFSATDTLTSHELRKFLMKTTEINIPGRAQLAFKEYFVRFMVLSLKYSLIEDTEKAILQMLDRDYLKPEDEALFRQKCQETFNKLLKEDFQGFITNYYETSKDDYIAQFPRRVLLETAKEVPYGTRLLAQSKVSDQMGLNLAICGLKMGMTIALIPIGDLVSREIIESNPMMKSFAPLFGSLRLRRPIADQHTRFAIGG
jgi:hypothetical protein